MRYKIFGLIVESDIELEGAMEIQTDEEAEVLIRRCVFSEEEKVILDIEKQEKVGKLSHYSEEESVIRCKGIGIFKLLFGKEIRYDLYEAYDQMVLPQFILCSCFPVLLLQRNMTLVHGSAILYKEKVLMISGESGSGKSSLAQEIMQRNHKQLTDDIIAVKEKDGKFVVVPSFPIRKLCVDQVEKYHLNKEELLYVPDDGKEKYGLPLTDEYCDEEKMVGALVVIRPGNVEKPQLQQITGADKMKYLMNNLFRLDYFEQVAFTPDKFLKNVRLANEMKIYDLQRPNGKMTVKEQADLLDAELEYEVENNNSYLL